VSMVVKGVSPTAVRAAMPNIKRANSAMEQHAVSIHSTLAHQHVPCKKVALHHKTVDMKRRRGGQSSQNGPIVPKKLWEEIPGWIALLPERGLTRKCWNGCPLRITKQDGRRYKGCKVRGCTTKPKAGERILACAECRWSVCKTCNAERTRMPTLARDPLFHGPDDPCMLSWPHLEQGTGSGTMIIVPGGNYEFLSPLEGLPVVEWLSTRGIASVVLRHRLLPDYGLEDCLDDLEAAVHRMRSLRPGPVGAIGFSAGGHLLASLALRAKERGEQQPLDAQVLVYPGIDAQDWHHPEWNGFFNRGRWTIPTRAASLDARQSGLLEGVGFAAPTTCLVASTEDTYCLNVDHSDIYHRHLEGHDVPNLYLTGAFGEHGFQLKGGWTPECIKWLHSRGFGLGAAG